MGGHTPLQELTRARTYAWGRCHSLHWYPAALEEQVWQRYCVLGSCVTQHPPRLLSPILLFVALSFIGFRLSLTLEEPGRFESAARFVKDRISAGALLNSSVGCSVTFTIPREDVDIATVFQVTLLMLASFSHTHPRLCLFFFAAVNR